MPIDLFVLCSAREGFTHSQHKEVSCLSTLATDAPGKLDVLGHDGDTFGVDGAQVGVLEESNQVSLRCFLESLDGRSLESQVSLEVLGDLTDKTLEGQLADEKLGGLLVATDLAEGHGSWTVTVGLLDAAGGGRGLARGLGGQLLAGRLATGGLASGLLGTGHGFGGCWFWFVGDSWHALCLSLIHI